MRVGIVTITELDNYGNRLQNYGLQRTLQKMGVEVETLHNYIAYRYLKETRFKFTRIVKGILFHDKKKLSQILRQLRFEQFDKKYFNFSSAYSTFNYISENVMEQYDFFIAGSDQIWNPHFLFNFEFNFLTFADYKQRIAYSASFGIDEIPEDKAESFKKYVDGMRCISTREYAGADIVKKLTGRQVPVVIDPSLLLDKEEWEHMENRPRYINKDDKYIVVYHLGSAENKQAVLEKLFEKYKDYKRYKVFDIGDNEKVREFATRPDEFIWCVHHAELVVTDSFHATLFSLIMETPLYYTNRVDGFISMNSRVESLFRLLNLSFPNNEEIFTKHITDAELLKQAITDRQQEAIEYLKTSLEIKNKYSVSR